MSGSISRQIASSDVTGALGYVPLSPMGNASAASVVPEQRCRLVDAGDVAGMVGPGLADRRRVLSLSTTIAVVTGANAAILSPDGQIALTTASRTSVLSNNYGSFQTTIGPAAFAFNDDVFATSGRHVTVYAGYDEAQTLVARMAFLTFGREIDAVNFGLTGGASIDPWQSAVMGRHRCPVQPVPCGSRPVASIPWSMMPRLPSASRTMARGF